MKKEIKCPVCGCNYTVTLNDVTKFANVYACAECGVMRIFTATNIMEEPEKEKQPKTR